MQQAMPLQQRLLETLLAEAHLTPVQFFVLKALEKQGGPCNLTQLSHMISSSPAIMTGVVDRLVRSGFVGRDPDSNDRRVILASLTAEGTSALAAVDQRLNSLAREFFARISDHDQIAIGRVLSQYLHFLEGQTGIES